MSTVIEFMMSGVSDEYHNEYDRRDRLHLLFTCFRLCIVKVDAPAC
jgi:hypothetical protein